MVQSTVANSILGTLQGIAAAPGKLASTRAQELQNQSNEYLLNQQAQIDLVTDIEQANDYRIKPTDASGALFQYDMKRIYEERPDLALKIFNSDKRFNVATDENGRKFETEISRFVTNEDGSISAVVRRTDGREVPLTENRSAAGDDVVVKLTPEDFNKMGSNILGSMVARGGGNNAATFFRDAAGLTNALVRDQLANQAASSEMANDPAAMSQFYAVVNRASDEELRQIATDLGVDVPAIQAVAEEQIAQAGVDTPEEDTAPAPAPTTQGAGWSIDSVDRSTKAGKLIAQSEGVGRKPSRRAKLPSRAVAAERLAAYRSELEEDIAAIEKRRANLKRPLRVAPENDTLLKKRAELEQIDAYLNRDQQAETTAPSAPRTAGAQPALESAVEPPPVPVFDRNSVISAIQEGTAQPTQQQYDAMAKYLQDKGVRTAQDLRKLPDADAHMAVWLAASRQPGSVSDRLNVASQMLNYIQTGSIATTPSQAATSSARYGELQLSRERFRNELGDAYDEQVNAALEDFSELQGLIVDDSGSFFLDSANSGPASIKLNEIWNKYKLSDVEGPQRLAYAQIAMESLLTHMLAKSNSSSPGLFEVAKKLDNWRNSDGQIRIGRNAVAGLVRETEDGFEFIDPTGGNLNFTIRKGAIRRTYGDDVFAEIQALARANQS